MELKYAGLLIGMILTFSMMLGALLSGWLHTRLVKCAVLWQIGIPLIRVGITIPTSLAYFLWPAGNGIQFLGIEMLQAMIFFMLMGFFSSWVPAASMAALSNIIPAHQRAVVNAVYVVFYTVLGFGIGPVFVGMLSDVLAQFAGKEGLRYALAALSLAIVLSMLFYIKTLKPYLEANN